MSYWLLSLRRLLSVRPKNGFVKGLRVEILGRPPQGPKYYPALDKTKPPGLLYAHDIPPEGAIDLAAGHVVVQSAKSILRYKDVTAGH